MKFTRSTSHETAITAGIAVAVNATLVIGLAAIWLMYLGGM